MNLNKLHLLVQFAGRIVKAADVSKCQDVVVYCESANCSNRMHCLKAISVAPNASVIVGLWPYLRVPLKQLPVLVFRASSRGRRTKRQAYWTKASQPSLSKK